MTDDANDDEERFGEFVRSLVDSYVEMRKELDALPADEREQAERTNALLLKDLIVHDERSLQIRERVLALALQEQGSDFAAWVDGLMALSIAGRVREP